MNKDVETEVNDKEPEQETDNIPYPFIAGIGASAGGLEALEKFFTHVPEKTGIAYVVVQHLSPDHKSMMIDLLGRYTRMDVVMVKNGMQIEVDKVFLIPAGKIMRINKDRFELTPKAPHTLSLPIDIFLNSLADAVGSRAVGIILSGTGSDGSRGAIAVNAAGGFLMAQRPDSAKFDGMPSSVIATGLVDAILPAEELPKRLISFVNNIPVKSIIPQPTDDNVPLSEGDAFEGILQLLLQASGIDFHDYKMATILRRIQRRMQVRHSGRIDQYFDLMKRERAEVMTLKKELLIGVTNFFRDGDAFETITTEVIQKIVNESKSSSTIRVWVAGTSTGEEAYSIGMLFFEAFEKVRRWPNLKIFATDISQDSIDHASAGVFPESIASEVTRERLERFFSNAGSSFEVKSDLRQCIVFAKHNLLSDPPFTQMNLVTCRNTLIYFTQEAQQKALQRLQFATQIDGFLFLGSSESIKSGELGFSVVHAKHKIFKRASRGPSSAFDTNVQAFSSYRAHQLRASSKHIVNHQKETSELDIATRVLIDQYAPPSMLINNHNDIIHLFGNVQPFFMAREGSASLSVNRILPDKMLPVASALMYKVLKDNKRMVSDYIPLKLEDDRTCKVRLSVSTVSRQDDESLLLLSFEQQQDDHASLLEPINVDAETMERVGVLERELSATRESLQATIEELETSNEELQATNEELMAANEELQSSNEELQSVNEEMNTVNAEYQEKVNILNRVNADLNGMTQAVGVATIFVDSDLNLTRYSPDALKIFKLRDTDLGRPLDEINNLLAYDNLNQDLQTTLLSQRMSQKEVSTTDDLLYVMRIVPYRFSTDSYGVVATFVDITAFRESKRLQGIIDALPEHIAVIDHDGMIKMVNGAWTRFARGNGDSNLTNCGIGRNYLEACKPNSEKLDKDKDEARAYLGIKSVLDGSSDSFSLQYPCHSPTEKRWFVMNVAPIQSDEFAAVVSHINITSWFHEKRSSRSNK